MLFWYMLKLIYLLHRLLAVYNVHYISRESPTTRNLYWSRASLCLCLAVYLSVPRRMPTLLHAPGCNLEEWQGVPPSCAIFGGFAIGARVSLL